LQLEYTNRLIQMIGGKITERFPNAAKSMALYNLQKIRTIASNGSGNVQTKAHKAHLKLLIDKALEN